MVSLSRTHECLVVAACTQTAADRLSWMISCCLYSYIERSTSTQINHNHPIPEVQRQVPFPRGQPRVDATVGLRWSIESSPHKRFRWTAKAPLRHPRSSCPPLFFFANSCTLGRCWRVTEVGSRHTGASSLNGQRAIILTYLDLAKPYVRKIIERAILGIETLA